MAVTGLGVGEVIRLDRDEVDDRDQLLRIIYSKFGICRLRHMPNYVAPRTMLRRRVRRAWGPGMGLLRGLWGGGRSRSPVLNATYFGWSWSRLAF
jgi:hypothetical protein